MLNIDLLKPLRYGANSYLVWDGGSCEGAVIDPSADMSGLARYCLDGGILIRRIFLTHGHYDHIISLSDARKQFPDARICIGAGDGTYLSDNELNCADLFGVPDFACPEADDLLCEGTEIPLGSERITVMHTPGHTPGSVCLFCGGDMFTGDTLFAGTVGRSDLPGGNREDLEMSLKRLAESETDFRIFPGHGVMSRISEERKTNPFIKVLC